MKNLTWRFVLILISLVVGVWALYPTMRYYLMSEAERNSLPPHELIKLKKQALNLGLDLYGGMYLLLEIDKSKLKPEDIPEATSRALEIIRNRIDQWGVFEPTIQKVGNDRILVQLPGVMESERARGLIGQTALLEFRLVAKPQVVNDVLLQIDENFRESNITPLTTGELDTFKLYHPFSSLLNSDPRTGRILVQELYWDSVEKFISQAQERGLIPSNYVFLWGKIETIQGRRYKPLYLVESTAALTGTYITDARHTLGTGTDPKTMNRPVVHLTFDRTGASIFARITGEHIGEQLAIVLDNVVQSAPVIQERIPGGNAMITGLETMEEARDLAIILKSGALPAPVIIAEERTVGPALGKDSIRKGFTAFVVSLIAVLIFMPLYYRISGLIADLALLLNFLFILAILSGFKATLTLPGLAGLILTIGMSVDANILIFERIREELRSGKNFKNALDNGFRRATVTILDANITTLIAALVLMRFGTGPIKGFAVVLSCGIIVSMFTAIFVSRFIFDYLTTSRKMSYVPI